MDRERIIEATEKYVRENVPSSREPKEKYFDHVFGARGYALMLAREYKANEFVVDMAILLHDIGADAGKVHAEKSAELATEFLGTLDIEVDTKKKIINCIRTHSMGSDVETLEQQIIQDSDGLIFIADSYKFFYEKGKVLHSDKTEEELLKVNQGKVKGMTEKIKTEKGKELVKELLPKAIQWLKEQENE